MVEQALFLVEEGNVQLASALPANYVVWHEGELSILGNA
jgi:hypothetical protein